MPARFPFSMNASRRPPSALHDEALLPASGVSRRLWTVWSIAFPANPTPARFLRTDCLPRNRHAPVAVPHPPGKPARNGTTALVVVRYRRLESFSLQRRVEQAGEIEDTLTPRMARTPTGWAGCITPHRLLQKAGPASPRTRDPWDASESSGFVPRCQQFESMSLQRRVRANSASGDNAPNQDPRPSDRRPVRLPCRNPGNVSGHAAIPPSAPVL